MFKFLFLLGLVTTMVNAQITNSGGCPTNINAMSPFDWRRYSGSWYQHARVPSSFDLLGKCIMAQYTINNATTGGTLNYRQTNMNSSVVTSSNGTITIANATVGMYNVNMPGAQMPLDVKILATDYTNWAVAYSCLELPFMHMEFAWIKTRQRFPLFLTAPWEILKTAGINTTLVLPVDHVTCPLIY